MNVCDLLGFGQITLPNYSLNGAAFYGNCIEKLLQQCLHNNKHDSSYIVGFIYTSSVFFLLSYLRNVWDGWCQRCLLL